jgi:hypothetical protein
MVDPLQPPGPTLEYFATPPSPPRPMALVVIAWIFIALGILAALDMATAIFRGNLKIDFNILMIFVGRGLLRNARGWRTVGLVFIWMALIGLPIVMELALLYPATGSIQFNQRTILISPSANVREAFLVVVSGSFWVASVWAYRVLTRPDVRQRFGVRSSST